MSGRDEKSPPLHLHAVKGRAKVWLFHQGMAPVDPKVFTF